MSNPARGRGRGKPVVVLAVHGYPPRIGGSEIHTQALARGLSRRGYRPIVLTRRRWREPVTDSGSPVVTRGLVRSRIRGATVNA